MAKKKAVNEELSVTTLSSGMVYLGVVSKTGIKDAFDLGAKTFGMDYESIFRDYLKELNLGRLSPINFSPVSDYTSRPLSQIEAACYAEVLGWFKMAKDQAVAQNENNCFDRLFVKK